MKEEIKERLQRTETWMRAFFMLLFVFLQGIVKFLVLMVAVFQFGCVALTGHTNAQLLRLGRQLAAYAYQIISFLTFNTEQRPFPFSAWPSETEAPHEHVNQERTD
ncbi:MAG TPA: DUF4389 domain-containing protein [Nitrosomonas halophila]|nr:DUF4389 domain-containing protein [Nitrosomonas halophila]